MEPRLNVLHVVEPRSGEEGVLACAAAMAGTPDRHSAVVIGTRRGTEFAARLGVCAGAVVAPPLGRPALAWRGLARAMDAVDRPDVVQCWSAGAVVAARGAVGAAVPIVGGFTGAASMHADSPLVHGAMASCVAVGPWRRGVWAGERNERSLDVRSALYPLGAGPAWNEELGPADRRTELRGRAAEGATLVTLLADPPGCGDARVFMFVMGLLCTAGHTVAGIVPRGCGLARRAARFVRLHGRRWGMLEWDGPLVELAGLSDIAVWPGGGPGSAGGGDVLSAIFMARGTPVVIGAGPGAAAVLGQGLPECVSRGPLQLSLATRVVPMLTDPALREDVRRRVVERGRELAREAVAGRQGLCTVLRDLWRDGAGDRAGALAGARTIGAAIGAAR